MVVSDNKLIFSNCEKYTVILGRETLLGYVFSSLFTQLKFEKG